MPRGWRAAALAAALSLPAAAHDGAHAPPAEENPPPLPFPVEIRAEFALTDQHGRRVEAGDFGGQPLILFFGYASCDSICPVALALMAEAVELGPPGVVPVLITVDPARDTPQALRARLSRLHPRFVGLTGSAEALAAARAAFQVTLSEAVRRPEGPVYAHGSFIYLIGPEGRVRAMLPPTLSAERLAALMRRHFPQVGGPASG